MGKRKEFDRPIEINDSTFWIKLPTVGQYMDMVDRGEMEMGKNLVTLWKKLALECVIDWHDIVEEETKEQIPFDYEVFSRVIPDQYLMKIGEEIYEKYLRLSDEEEEQFRGYIRYLYYLTDEDKGESRRKSFNCKNCVKKGQYKYRKCGQSEQFIEAVKDQLKKEGEEISKGEKKKKGFDMEAFKKRYGSAARNRGGPRISAPKEKKHRSEFNLLGFSFDECPVSWVKPKTREWGERLYYCVKNDFPFFGGGLSDQPNKVFEAMRVIQSESSEIEREMMDKKTKQASKKGRRPRRR